MIVNLYVDHLMPTSPTSAEEVWNATREHPKLFSDAADRIGLTPSEYREFRNNLLDGKALYVKLPRRLDAMSGVRHGSVYAVKNARMNQTIMGWRVDLADGNVVYVPQICGNISLLKHAAIAHVQRKRHPYVAHARHVPYTPAIAHVPETPVVVTPPEEVPAETAPTVAQAIPAAATHGSPFFFFIPAAVAGLVAGLSHGSTVLPCSHGSNNSNVCQK